jgi:hypothetical protein
VAAIRGATANYILQITDRRVIQLRKSDIAETCPNCGQFPVPNFGRRRWHLIAGGAANLARRISMMSQRF